MTTISGFVAKGHEPEILASWPLDLAHGLQIQPAARPIALWLLFLLGLTLLRESAKSRSLRKREAELLQVIRTMPPPKVLEQFNAYYCDLRLYIVEQVDRNPDADSKKAAVESGIRYSLNCLAMLMAQFQRSTFGSRYAANVMIFKPIRDILPDQRDAIYEPDDEEPGRWCRQFRSQALERTA